MIVLLKADFFAPNNTLYVRDALGTAVPDEFRDWLPETSVVIKSRLERPPESVRRASEPDLNAMQALDAERAAGAALAPVQHRHAQGRRVRQPPVQPALVQVRLRLQREQRPRPAGVLLQRDGAHLPEPAAVSDPHTVLPLPLPRPEDKRSCPAP